MSVNKYLVLYKDIRINPITTPTKADTIEAMIPPIPSGVRTEENEKNTTSATIKTSNAPYE
ncbi:MAG: hypothetical protein PVF96_02720 [Candidatus Bathyarchaeota archaeon]